MDVTDVAAVKGLEFDYVILVEVSAASFPETPSARRLLHVGATRAVHQLWLTSVATPSPLVRDQISGATRHDRWSTSCAPGLAKSMACWILVAAVAQLA